MHLFYRCACFVLLIFAVSGSYAQVVSIRDMESYRPMELVTLASEEPRASAVTNTRGQANIHEFEGSLRIEIRRLGYATLHLSFAELKNSGFVVFLSPANISLDQVVVSATRWNQPRREVPARILSINPREIVLNNPQTTADMLALSGEVFIQKSQQGGGSPMIRGFSTNRLLLTVDGVRMNTAIFRSGNLQNVISLDALAIQNTEILFGPGSVMYGSDAIAGVMSFYTLRPEFSDTTGIHINGSALSRYATANGEQTVHLDLKLGGKKWASVTSLSRNYFGNLRMGSFGPRDYLRPEFVIQTDTADVVVNNDDPRVQRPTGYSQINLMQKIRFSPSEAWDLNYGWHYSTTSDYSRYDRLIRYRGGLPRSAEWYYGPQVWMMNNLSVNHKGSTLFRDRAEIRLAHQYFKESRIDRDFNDTELRTRTENVNAFSANLDYIKETWGPVKMLYGFEMIFNDVVSEGTDRDISTMISQPGPSRYPKAEWYSMAAYLTGHASLSEKTNLQAGIRYNRYILNAVFDTSFYPLPFTTANINDGALSGSVGFIYSPSRNWAINLNLSSGFRSPNVDDLGKVFDSEPGAVVVPNPELKAEYAWNIEAGLARVFGEKIKLDLSGYYTLLDNAMVRRDFLLNGLDSIVYNGELSRVQAVQNSANATIYGLQAGVEVKLPSGFGLSSHINIQHGEEELDNGSYSPLRHAAPWYGTTRLSYSAKKLKTDVYAVYNGAVSYLDMPEEEKGKAYLYAADKNGNPWSPGWYTLNLKVKYRFNPHFAITGGIENITDRRYKPYSSGIAGAGRSFQAGMRADF